MPELPEVEIVRRQLAERIVGRTLVAGDAHPSVKFAPALDALGATITTTGRRGKYLLFGLDDDREIVAHLGMTGSFSIVPDRSQGYPDCSSHDAYTRVVWRMDDGNDLVFRDTRRFGRIRVVVHGNYDDIPTLANMGPEPLAADFTGAVLYERLSRSNRAVKTQLLSQRPVAGVGNIYADEALHMAGVHPKSRRLGRARCDSLAQAIKHVLAGGIEHGGTTLRDYVNAEGSTGSNQHELLVYGRRGEPCTRCGTELRSMMLDARTTTYCPSCQRH